MPDTPMYQLGALPGEIPVGLQPLNYYVAGSLPKPPPKVAVPAVADWLMLGNGPDPANLPQFPNGAGDCGVAGLEHGFMCDAAATGEQETFATTPQAQQYYLGYTGGQDSGVVLSKLLAYVRQNGYYGHTVGAFTHFSPQDVATMHSVVDLYDFAYTGIKVTQGMMQATGSGQPWQLQDLLTPVLGGHCIIIAGYDDRYLYAITWGKVQAISYPAWSFMSSEAWAVMAGELDHGDGRGVNYAALQADLDKLAA